MPSSNLNEADLRKPTLTFALMKNLPLHLPYYTALFAAVKRLKRGARIG